MSINRSLWGAGVIALGLLASNLYADVVQRGSPIPADSTVTPLAGILSNPQAYDGQMVVTEGTVRKVCMFAGCWMTVGEGDTKPSMKVTFSKGAFTVPRSSHGSHARLMGKVKVVDEKATFVAKGVELRRE